VLQVVVIPFICTHLEWLGDNQPTIFADKSRVLNEFDLQSLINYCIALNSLTAIDGHDRQYFNELRARVVSP
jgi:hypothetical protein